jgi:hypothetical protein
MKYKEIVMPLLSYFAGGTIVLFFAILITNKLDPKFFWEYNRYSEEWERNYAEIGLFIIWPLVVIGGFIALLFKIFTGITSVFIKNPNNTDELRGYLKSRGCNVDDIKEVEKEMSDLLK